MTQHKVALFVTCLGDMMRPRIGFAALKLLQRPEEVAARRGLPIEDVAPAGMLRARRESDALAAAAAREGSA